MRLLRKTSRLSRFLGAFRRAPKQELAARTFRRCGIEALEPRQLMVGDLHLGAVYFEEATGDDSAGDRIELTFAGGQPGTQLKSVTINGDKLLDGGVTLGDIFFDTTAGGKGSFKSVPLSIVGHDGFTITNVVVEDGSPLITFQFTGFDAGEKLVFEIDVDEQGLFSSTSVAEGGEFEGSQLTGTFINQHYEDTTLTAVFFDEYDHNFTQAAQQSGSPLNLPRDSYVPPSTVDREDRTAGAVATAVQIPKPITISGRVFDDPNVSNSQDTGELGIAGVSLSLLQWNGTAYTATGKTATTNTLGDYKFQGLLPGKYRVVETQPGGYLSVGSRPGTVNGQPLGVSASPDIISEIELLGGQDTVRNDFAEVRPGSIGGRVYADPEGDCVFGPQDKPLPGVEVQLLGVGGTVLKTTFTDANGLYKFEGLMPGTYGVHEVQPAGYYQGGQKIGSAGGVISAPDVTSQIVLTAATGAMEYDFCEFLPAELSGRVFADPEGDCVFGTRDLPLAGVTIEVVNAQGAVVQTVQTDAQGKYSFTNLAPGAYSVRETQPAGYYQGGQRAGSHGGDATVDNLISHITLGSAAKAINYDFCELIPGSISGRVFADPEGDCVFGPQDTPLAGVAVQLLDSSGAVVQTMFTNSRGEYRFENLAPGSYGVREVQPAGYYQGGTIVGDAGGVIVADDQFGQIVLHSATDAAHYDFCELLPASLRGRVYADPEGDCVFGPQDIPLAGVKIELLDDHDVIVATVVTGADGRYEFNNLAPAKYSVRETQPAGYYQGGTIVGDAGGVIKAPDVIGDVLLTSARNASGYDFCELIPGNISGRVFADPEADCVFGPLDQPLVGVVVDLLNANGQQVGSTLTDAQGKYKFENLAPGTYSVREHQPNGYFQGGTMAGSVGGVVNGDVISQIALVSATNAIDYNFCELIPSSIGGRVFADPEADCVFGPLDRPLGGVVVDLLNANGQQVGSTLTDAQGKYKFENLAPGTYSVREHQPAGYFQGGTMAGSVGGTVSGDMISHIALVSATDAIDYNFCELIPGSISGRIHADTDGDCILDPGELPLAGVTVQLFNDHGIVVGTTLTNSQGQYRFEGLAPGVYSVREQQPPNYFDGEEHAGTAGGVIIADDFIGQIVIGSGTDAREYNFCEIPIASISGYVFQDGPTILVPPGQSIDPNTVRDGRRDPSDLPIAGVTLILGDATGEAIRDALGQPRTTVTGANGYYQFVGLLPGLYTIRQIQPADYLDFIDTPGTSGGIAINRDDSISPLLLETLTVAHDFDAIIRIPLAAGVNSVENNFSEIKIGEAPPARLPIVFPEPINPQSPHVYSAGYVIPQQVAKSFPEPIPEFVPPPFVAGHRVIASTWHLSVVDGGIPRGPRDGEMLVEAQSNMFNVSTWTGAKMDEAQWMLVTDSDRPVRTQLFGMPDSVPIAGDFNGDGRTEIGVFVDGDWFIDINGNGVWDEDDLWAKLGSEGDLPVVGDWDGDGKDDIGVFGHTWSGDPRAIKREPGLPHSLNTPKSLAKNMPPDKADAPLRKRMVKVSVQGSLRADLIDHVFSFGVSGDYAIAGDWAGNGVDCIGVFRNGVWHLDVDGDGRFTSADRRADFGRKGDIPLVGDWNGDGIDELGVYRDGEWILDMNRNYQVDAEDKRVKLGGRGDQPVVGDWDGTGHDQIGVMHGGRIEHQARR